MPPKYTARAVLQLKQEVPSAVVEQRCSLIFFDPHTHSLPKIENGTEFSLRFLPIGSTFLRAFRVIRALFSPLSAALTAIEFVRHFWR